MRLSIIQKWVAIGLFEIGLSLYLISIAPMFINSEHPLIGFLIWVFVLMLLMGSGIYVLVKGVNAERSRRLFMRKFPEYSELTLEDFWGLSYREVAHKIRTLESLKNDENFQSLNISLLDILWDQKRP